MRDNHLHTYFSYDSKEEFTTYLDAYEGEIVTTEHFDLSNPYPDPEKPSDDVPDYAAYIDTQEKLCQRYGPRLKRGIEIGYFQPREADILDYLAGKSFDLKLLSVHHNGFYDYLDIEGDVPKEEIPLIIQDYLDRLEYAIGRVDAHVLAHFDYGFRRFALTVDELKNYQDQLIRIFEKMKNYGLAFELNAKSMYLYDHEDLYRYALGLLKEVGAYKLSIGSDGHHLGHFRLHFDRIETLLEEPEFAKVPWEIL